MKRVMALLRLGKVSVCRKRVLFKALRTLEFLVGLLFLHIGVGGVMATTYGMQLFKTINLGGAVVEDIVNPITAFGMNGLIVSGGIVAVGLLLMRRLWLIPLRYPIRFLKKKGIKAPRGIFGSPVTFYRAMVRFRNWFLAKVEYLQSESAKWKALFTTLKLPYTALRSLGFSPQMAMTLLFAGTTVGTGVVANEVFEGKSFSRGDSGVYSAPLDAPVEWSEEYNTLRLDLGTTSVGNITISDISLGTAYTGSALPSGESNVIYVGGIPASSNPTFAQTYLEVGHLIIDRWRCERLDISDSEIHHLIISGNASDGQSISAVPGTPRNRGIGGGNRADDMTTSGGYYDMLKITSASSGVNGKVDVLKLSNLYSKGGACTIKYVKAGTMEVTLNEVGGDENLATKAFTVATSVIYKSFTNEENVEVAMAVPAVQ
jgi:hypothetical protein